jgi:fatty acid omega-hydroxylase
MAVEDDHLPDGTFIPKGTLVAFMPYHMGRSKSIWGPDATSFDPERFLDANGSVIEMSPYKFPAFQAGPRTCLGRSMAYLEATAVLATVWYSYDLSLVAGHVVEPAESLTLPMKNGLRVTVSRRER